MTMPSPPLAVISSHEAINPAIATSSLLGRVAGSDQFVGLADQAFTLLLTNQRSIPDIHRAT